MKFIIIGAGLCFIFIDFIIVKHFRRLNSEIKFAQKSLEELKREIYSEETEGEG